MLVAPSQVRQAVTNRSKGGPGGFRMSGPAFLLLMLAGLFLGVLAGVRGLLVRRVKNCKTCRAYGIIRCRLCDGQGSVLWRGKSNHEETCPLCLTKRYVTCPDCGGHYHRKMFSHSAVPGRGRGPIADFLMWRT